MNLILEMEEYAKNNYVPIARKENINYLQTLIRENKIKKVLELGCAIGYSSICMAMASDEVKITTIERNKEMYDEAVKNVMSAGLNDKINIIFDDIFNVELDEKFDLIFIDAAKAQYIKFFEKFKNNLNDNGFIVSDNLDLKDLQKLTDSKRSKRLVLKMSEYKSYLINLKDYETIFLEIGDGFAITKLKNN